MNQKYNQEDPQQQKNEVKTMNFLETGIGQRLIAGKLPEAEAKISVDENTLVNLVFGVVVAAVIIIVVYQIVKK